jgi:hypothetical protein
MSLTPSRHPSVGQAIRLSLLAALVFLGVALVVTPIFAINEFIASGSLWWVAMALLGVLGELALASWAWAAYAMARTLIATDASVATLSGRLERLETLLEDQGASSRKLIELVALSDQAKSLLFRDREIATMREMVHDYLIKQDYRGAEALIATWAQEPAYADEVVSLRKEVEDSRKATIDQKLDIALARVQESLDAADFARASRDAQRIMRAFGGNPKAAQLPQRIDSARNKRKRDLLQAYGEAVSRNDVDRGIELLRELDKYLTPQEGAALADSARGVFRARLHNLGVQFAIRVTEKAWKDAIAAGEEIMREFPNSRMAAEVSAKLEQLRAKAAEGR